MTGPTLTTDRLILRPPEAEDLDGFAALMADETAARFIGGVQSRHGAWRSMASMRGSWALHGFGAFSVLDRATGAWIGRAGPWHPADWPGDEVMWAFLPSAWGRGFATEAASASIAFARDTLGWREAIHVIHPENRPSQAVAGRVGARLLRHAQLPPPFHGTEFEIWGQTFVGQPSLNQTGTPR